MEIERVGRSAGGGRGGAWRTVAMLVSPIVAVALVVTVSLVGGKDDADPVTSSPPPIAAASPSASPAAPDADRIAAAPGPAYPDEMFGLRTRSVAVVRDERRRDEIGSELVAVRGYLTIRPGLDGCLADVATPGSLRSTACVRQTLLTDDREPMLGWADDDTIVRVGDRGRAHLHGWVFPGVSMAAAEAYVATEPPPMGGGSALGAGYFLVPNVPVVAIGRFDDARLGDAETNGRHPGEAFTIERIAWVAGAVQRTPVVRLSAPDDADETIDGAVLTALREAAAEALPADAVVLGLTVADEAALASMDPSVARSIDPGSRRDPLWFARAALVGSGAPGWMADRAPRLAWVVVDREGTRLGSAIVD